MSIERWTKKNAKVRKDLNMPACGFRAIKVLTDLFCVLRRCSIDI